MSALFVRVDRAERRMCLLANAACRRRLIRNTFRVISRLGDGVFWYALIATMPLITWTGGGSLTQGLWISLEMLATGAFGLLFYKALKKKLVRERPYIGLIGIECAMPPLDRPVADPPASGLPTTHLIVLIGPPGCGKSTLARQWQAAAPDRHWISTDAIRGELFGDAAVQGDWSAIWQVV